MRDFLLLIDWTDPYIGIGALESLFRIIVWEQREESAWSNDIYPPATPFLPRHKQGNVIILGETVQLSRRTDGTRLGSSFHHPLGYLEMCLVSSAPTSILS